MTAEEELLLNGAASAAAANLEALNLGPDAQGPRKKIVIVGLGMVAIGFM